jgi:hypothetical protein
LTVIVADADRVGMAWEEALISTVLGLGTTAGAV